MRQSTAEADSSKTRRYHSHKSPPKKRHDIGRRCCDMQHGWTLLEHRESHSARRKALISENNRETVCLCGRAFYKNLGYLVVSFDKSKYNLLGFSREAISTRNQFNWVFNKTRVNKLAFSD